MVYAVGNWEESIVMGREERLVPRTCPRCGEKMQKVSYNQWAQYRQIGLECPSCLAFAFVEGWISKNGTVRYTGPFLIEIQ